MAFFTKETLLTTYAYVYLVMEKHGLLDKEVGGTNPVAALKLAKSTAVVETSKPFCESVKNNGTLALGNFLQQKDKSYPGPLRNQDTFVRWYNDLKCEKLKNEIDTFLDSPQCHRGSDA